MGEPEFERLTRDLMLNARPTADSSRETAWHSAFLLATKRRYRGVVCVVASAASFFGAAPALLVADQR